MYQAAQWQSVFQHKQLPYLFGGNLCGSPDQALDSKWQASQHFLFLIKNQLCLSSIVHDSPRARCVYATQSGKAPSPGQTQHNDQLLKIACQSSVEVSREGGIVLYRTGYPRP